MPTATVIIVTYNRPDCVKTCLGHLRKQARLPERIIVVDASADDRTQAVCAGFPESLYVRNTPGGYGSQARSRNIGLRHAVGEIIAFLDDDSFAHPAWLEELLRPYEDPAVGGVGGRALRNQPDEDKQGVDQIGKLLLNGELTGNFAADPGKNLEIDHAIGCNMSFRREIIESLGGFRELFPGVALREETDPCLRVKRLGYKIIFAPKAVVDHIGAPKPRGERFDIAYSYYGQRNHVVLLAANFGFGSAIFRRYLLHSCYASLREFVRAIFGAARRILGGFSRIAAGWAGLFAGLSVAARLPREEKQNAAAAPRAGAASGTTGTEKADSQEATA